MAATIGVGPRAVALGRRRPAGGRTPAPAEPDTAGYVPASHTTTQGDTMIRVLVAYPRSEGTRFDADYYIATHMDLVRTKLPGIVRAEADVALDDTQPYHAVAHMVFDSIESFGAAMGSPAAAEVIGDVVNYTDIAPSMQISRIFE
jgi:uncharacterized protein (TIGR02118 family)